jgi:hypothetical protein
VNDFLVISLGAILGANARWIVSRYAARILGPVFPYGGNRTRAARSSLALANCGWFLRRLHHIFQLRLRDHGLLRTRPVAPHVSKFPVQQSTLSGRRAGGHGTGPRLLSWTRLVWHGHSCPREGRLLSTPQSQVRDMRCTSFSERPVFASTLDAS